MDLSNYSDEELMAIAGGPAPAQANAPRGIRNNNPLNLEATVDWRGMQGNDGRFAVFPDMETGFAAADRNLQTYHQKYGINTIDGVVNRWAPPSENDSRNYAQFVSQKLGVSPDQPLDMTDPTVRQSLMGAMAEMENGQPVGVAMPQQSADLSGFTDEELMAIAGIQPPAAAKAPPKKSQQIARSQNGGVTVEALGPDPTIAQDAAAGFMQPIMGFLDTAKAGIQNAGQKAMAGPPRLRDAPREFLGNMADTAGLVGSALGVTSAPVQAVVKPTARAINRNAPTMYAAPKWSDVGKGQMPRVLNADERQAKLEGDINLALSAAAPAKGRVPKPTPMKGRSLEELDAINDAAWNKVDASGYRFPKTEVKSAAADIRALVDDAGPELYQQSNTVANRVEELASRGGLTPAQANRLRSQVSEKLMQPGSTEASVGAAIKSRIDELINTGEAASSELAAARKTHTTYLKYKNITDRLHDAGLNQVSAGTGGNSNATRQALKPLIKKRGNQRMMNATPDEIAALKSVVNGTPTQNLMRAGSAFDPFHSKLAALIQGGLGIKTGGLSAATIPLGMAATKAEQVIAAKNMQKMLDLFSTGGVKPVAPPPISYSGPMPVLGPTSGRVPILSARGGTGLAVTAAPLTRIPSARPSKETAKAAKSSPPRKRKKRE